MAYVLGEIVRINNENSYANKEEGMIASVKHDRKKSIYYYEVFLYFIGSYITVTEEELIPVCHK